jgi:hypothetical protein
MTEPHPAWHDMTDAQKFDFLHEWMMNVTNRLQDHGGLLHNHHERLLKVEGKVEDTS